ncbi:short chain dehydrogenase [Apiospora phragmitis]|uniref:Short chain dehydrogenase n=1 Tax=Apiospora phragmitis TaxID=2905665 RepID=A0ABR1VSA7_9PEZI
MQPPLSILDAHSKEKPWHNDVYPAIDYTNEKVSHQGETVVITGAGSGLGRETALAYAKAGAKILVLTGRNATNLSETATQVTNVSPNVQVKTVAADVTDESAVKQIVDAVDGTWHVLMHGAGHMAAPAPVVQTDDVADYWRAYEVNVKSTVLLAKYLFPKAATGASVVTVPGGAVVFPAAVTAGLSGYLVSKLALIKTVEYLAVENPELNVTAVHPGMVDTAMFRASGATPDKPMVHMDTPKLFAGFCLWVTRPEAKFLSGRMVWANWDVDELKGKEEEITSKNLLTYVWGGFPFA